VMSNAGQCLESSTAMLKQHDARGGGPALPRHRLVGEQRTPAVAIRLDDGTAKNSP
jgi:hypothetical protein